MKHLLYICPLVFMVFGLSFSPLSAADSTSVDNAFWKSVYEENQVLNIEISITADGWKAMQPTRPERSFGQAPIRQANSFSYVSADIKVDGTTFSNVGLRFKGNSSYQSSSSGFKRPFKIDTNRFVKGQKLHGRTKLNLSNAFLDSSYMKEKLGYELYRAAGLPTPGVGWANVTLHLEGHDQMNLGVYVLIEQVDASFIERHFGSASKDSLLMKPELDADWKYPGDELSDYEQFEIKEGEQNEDQIRRFGEFLKSIHSTSSQAFFTTMASFMDLKQLAGYLAATSILSNIDSYIGMPHNYYLLMNKQDGKIHLLPWDVNEVFGTFTMGQSPEVLADWDIDRPWVARLRLLEKLFETKEFMNLYHQAMEDLMESTFTEKHLNERIASFEKTILPLIVETDSVRDIIAFDMAIDGDRSGYNMAEGRSQLAIKPFIRMRIQSIKDQIAGKRPGSTFDSRRRGSGFGPGPR